MKSILLGVFLSLIWSIGLHVAAVYALGNPAEPIVIETYRNVCWPIYEP